MKKLFVGLIVLFYTSITLADEYRLMFFYGPDCPWCHQMAPDVQKLADYYRLKLVGNSIEPRFIEGLANNIHNLTLFRKHKVYGLPMLLLQNISTGEGRIVVRGAVFGEELQRQLLLVANELNSNRVASS
jgi:conjugal transfer pilus assembly protein TraF